MWTRPSLSFSRGRARQAAALCPVAANDPVLLMVFTHPPVVFCRSDLFPRACVRFIWKLWSFPSTWFGSGLSTQASDFFPNYSATYMAVSWGQGNHKLIYFIYFSPATAQWSRSCTLVTDFAADISPTVPSLSLLVLSCAKGHDAPNVLPTLSGSP